MHKEDEASAKGSQLGFSVPFIFSSSYVKFLKKINKTSKNYKIKRVYNSLSLTASGSSGFEHGRSVPFQNGSIIPSNLRDLKDIISEIQAEGIDFAYLMNNSATVSQFDFQNQIPKINAFVEELMSMGIRHITVSNQLLASYLTSLYKDLKVGASTIMNLASVQEASAAIETLGIRHIVPPFDLNKNFQYIDSLVKLNKDVKVELMADESCIFGCPTKNLHYALFGARENIRYCTGHVREFPINICSHVTKEYPELQIIKSKKIYPWEVPTYENHGVSLIKLVGRDMEEAALKTKIDYYIKGAVDKEYALEAFYSVYNSRFFSQREFKYGPVKVKDLLPYLIDISDSEKSKTDCRNVCGVGCRICYEKAESLKSSKIIE